MESSEEDDDFPIHEWITPQSKINSIYQSNTEKGIRKICCELLDLKDAVETLCGNSQSKYFAFLRMSEEVVEMEHELIELQKHASAHRILVQDLMSGVCHELEEWKQGSGEGEILEAELDPQSIDIQNSLLNDSEYRKMTFLEDIDVLLAEHKIGEAVEALIAEETGSPELNGLEDSPSTLASSYKSAFLKRKVMLEDKLVGVTEQPSVGNGEFKKALAGLVKLGKGSLAHQLLLKVYGSRLQKRIEEFLPSCSIYPETFSATLAKLVFSTILLAAKDSETIFGDMPVYTNRIVPWADRLLESFVQLVKENAPSPELVSAVRAVSICFQASFSHCLQLESHGLKLSNLLMVLLRPYMEEVLEMNFRRARKMAVDLTGNDDTRPMSPQLVFPLSSVGASSSDGVLINFGTRFIIIVEEIVEQLTPVVITHFGGAILTRISHLFDKYVGALIKALPVTSEDDNLTDHRETVQFRVESDAQQLALLGTAYIVAEEQLPRAVSRIWDILDESKELASGPTENTGSATSTTVEYKDWRRQLLNSWDKLRDHFCLQYVLSFIYSREGKTRLDARIYLNGKGEDLIWDSHPMPSLPFQALFAKLQQLATVAGDVLHEKDRIQKILLGRLTETVVMWLSDEQEFWGVFEDESCPLQPLGLQQLLLDIHFILELADYGGYSTRNVNQSASAIITRAIKVFSARGIDPQNALPEDEWFSDTAKAAINTLLSGLSGSEASETDDEHIVIHDDIISDSDDTASCPSTVESSESFASANMDESESPIYLTEPGN